MDIPKTKSLSRTDYERAVFTLKTIEVGKNYGSLARSKTKQVDMLHNCITRIGLKKEEIDKLSVIHVTGTKGKGSTCTFAEGILHNYGYRTGFFNSPHLLEVRERMMVDGKPVEEALFVSAFWHVYQTLHLTRAEHEGLMPGFFVFVLLMALHLFVQQGVEVVVMEVGIGGEYDATNFVPRPVVCGLTSLHLEHTDVLGHTLEEIAWHKSGIMKRGVPLVTVAHQDSVMAVILDRAKQKQCPVYLTTPLTEEDLGGGEVGIAGPSQTTNATLALHLCRLWRQNKGKAVTSCDVNGVDYPSDVINVKGITHRVTTALSMEEREGLLSARLPGRSQVIKKHGVTYYLDGAHTTHSMQHCVAWFNESAQREAAQLGCKVVRTLVFRMKKDKPVEKVLPYLTVIAFGQKVRYALDLCETPHRAKLTALSQLETWRNLQEKDQDLPLRPDAPRSALCFPSIVSGLWWAGLARDRPLQEMAMNDLARERPLQEMAMGDHNGLQEMAMGDLARDRPLQEMAMGDLASVNGLQEMAMGDLASVNGLQAVEPGPPCPNAPVGGEHVQHVQVLVTGSLALAGGVLSVLQPAFWG